MTTVPVPKGLSRGSADIWRALTTAHVFEQHELIMFERALVWFDKADAWLRASTAASGRAQAALVKQSMEASTCGLRYWRTLKFVDGAAARRPGRPSGDDWSAKRKLQKVV
jgi:hypothetical protein